MKPYLVDVPVKINIWIRPECQRKQFEVIRQARPSILFVTSDGGRNDEEWRLIKENRKIYENEIDWDCKVYYIYEDKNNGLYAMDKVRQNYIWKRVDRCVFLEDDQIPSVSFFRFCAEMLEKYKDDTRISMICGMNHLGVYNDVNTDYFFSRRGSIWGIAMWKRTYEQYYDFAYKDDPYVMQCLKQRTKKAKAVWKQICSYARGDYYEGHEAGEEFFLQFASYGQNQVQIIPKYNLISNVGSTGNSAHAGEIHVLPRGIRRVFDMKTYELSFPLKHPKYVMPDINYEKKRNRIMGINHPFVQMWRKAERAFLILRFEGMQALLKKLHVVYKRSGNRQIEK